MTLILAMACKGAVIVGSDTQVSDRRTRTTNIKIKQLNGSCVWAGAGEVSIIQRLEERLGELPGRDAPLRELREPIGLAIKATVEDALRIDYRVPYVKDDATKLDGLYFTTFAFAEHRGGDARVLSLTTKGGAEWYTHPHAIGSAADYAVALTKNYDCASLTPDRAALLVITTLEKAIETAQSGIDYPLDIWRIDENGAHQYDGGELARLYAEAQRLRDTQRRLIEGWEARNDPLQQSSRPRMA